MPESSQHNADPTNEQIAKTRRVIAVSKGVAVVTVVASLLLTSFATVLILIGQEQAADRMLDCVVPTGHCYQLKVRQVQATSDAEIVLIVTYCYQQTPENLETTRACVKKELEKR